LRDRTPWECTHVRENDHVRDNDVLAANGYEEGEACVVDRRCIAVVWLVAVVRTEKARHESLISVMRLPAAFALHT